MTKKQDQGHSKGDQPIDLLLARQIRDLDQEIQPSRDLWPGIERNIIEYPQRKKTEWRNDWMPYGVAASLLLAVSALVINLTGVNQSADRFVAAEHTISAVQNGYIKVRNPLVEQFTEVNKNLEPATLEELHRNIEIMEQARLDIEAQVRQNPEDQRLVEMLMRIHSQEIELLKQDYSKPSTSM